MKFLNWYDNNVTSIAIFLVVGIFIYIHSINLYKIAKYKLKLTLSYIFIWLPFLLSVFFIFALLKIFKDDLQLWLLSNADDHVLPIYLNTVKSTIINKWDFISCSFANIFLIFLSTVFYILDLFSIASELKNNVKVHLNFAVILCVLIAFLNFSLFFIFWNLIFNDYTGGRWLLAVNDFFSLLNMCFYLLIDHKIIVAAKKYLDDEKLKNYAISISKPASFAKYHVDLACIIGILFTIILQNEYIHLTDTVYEFAFTTGGITTQLFLTQFIFAIYQSFRLVKSI